MDTTPQDPLLAIRREQFLAEMKSRAEAPARASKQLADKEAAIQAEALALVDQFARKPKSPTSPLS